MERVEFLLEQIDRYIEVMKLLDKNSIAFDLLFKKVDAIQDEIKTILNYNLI